MICPSCSYSNLEHIRYCGRCRMAFSKQNLFLARLRDHLYWILRRSNGGFMAGVVAWFFIPALSRALASHGSPLLHFFTTGLLGGAFLGTVDGMLEESTPKTIRGAMMGGLGGALGGLLFVWLGFNVSDSPFWGLFMFWAIAGAGIGVVSAMWEKKKTKILAGVLLGALGGGVGGALGYSMYGLLMQEYDPGGWFLRRLYEGFSGGIIGVTLWFAIGVAERFVIFKRRPIEDPNKKHCDHCATNNPISSWYCRACGSVLQEAAAAQNLHLSPYTTLDRLQEMFRYLSRLSITTGFIAGLIVFLVFLSINPIFAFIAAILVALVSYSLLILFSSAAESIRIFIKTDK